MYVPMIIEMLSMFARGKCAESLFTINVGGISTAGICDEVSELRTGNIASTRLRHCALPLLQK